MNSPIWASLKSEKRLARAFVRAKAETNDDDAYILKH